MAYLGGKCNICGYARCMNSLAFHHVNALEKDFTISARMTSWEAIERELRKCVLLCANCHGEVHDGMHPSYLEDESHMRGGDDRQMEMFDEEGSFLDPTITPEEIRAEMGREDDLSRSFKVEPTMPDLLVPVCDH